MADGISMFVAAPAAMPASLASQLLSEEPILKLPTASDIGINDGQQAHEDAFSGKDTSLPPGQDVDPRFRWSGVSGAIDRPARIEADLKAAIKGWGPMDSRVFGTNILRAEADSDQSIGQFRIVRYHQGKIDGSKQIFPEVVGGLADSYKSMIIASQSQSYAERNQVLKSNKALHAYFFNDAPEVIQLQGFLKTTQTDPWDMAMLLLWDRLLRGTELARHNAILEFSIAGMTYWGYPLNFAYQMSAQSQFVASFSMQILIVDKLIPTENLNDEVRSLLNEADNDGATTNTMVEHTSYNFEVAGARNSPQSKIGPNPAGNPFSSETIASNAAIGASLPEAFPMFPAAPPVNTPSNFGQAAKGV